MAYISALPGDPFKPLPIYNIGYSLYGVFRGPDGETASYDRYPHDSWIGWSVGPDHEGQTGGYRSLGRIISNEARGDRAARYDGMRYDPTNGTLSRGDVYIFGPRAFKNF